MNVLALTCLFIITTNVHVKHIHCCYLHHIIILVIEIVGVARWLQIPCLHIGGKSLIINNGRVFGKLHVH